MGNDDGPATYPSWYPQPVYVDHKVVVLGRELRIVRMIARFEGGAVRGVTRDEFEVIMETIDGHKMTSVGYASSQVSSYIPAKAYSRDELIKAIEEDLKERRHQFLQREGDKHEEEVRLMCSNARVNSLIADTLRALGESKNA